MNIDKQRWEDAAQSFESSLMILRKDKNGWVIGFSVHPDDAPAELLDAPLGTRFRAVLFQIDDDEQPVIKIDPVEPKRQINEDVALAGKLCRDSGFQRFLLKEHWRNDGDNEVATVATLHQTLGITSRREIRTHEDVRRSFRTLVSEYNSLGLEKAGIFLEEA